MKLSIDEALNKGIEAHRTGQMKVADAYYTAILKVDPKHQHANHNLGVLAVQSGKVQTGLPFLKTALEANPNTAQFWLSYVDALIKLDLITEAKEVFDQAKVQGLRGDAFDQLENRLHTTITKISNSKEPPKDQLNLVIALYNQNEMLQVFDEARKLTKIYTESLTLWNLLGAAAIQIGQLNEAIRAFQKALSIKPDFVDAYVNMGIAFRKQGKTDKAILAYKKALVITPDSVDIHNNIGVAFHAQGKFEEAISAFNKAIEIKPNHADTYSNIGATLRKQGKLDAAIDAFRKALEIKPDNASIFNNIGVILKDQGKLEEAIVTYEKALEISPNFSEAHMNIGTALKNQGKIEEARRTYCKAITLQPNNADAYWNLCGVVENITEAKKWINKVVELDPTHLKARFMSCALDFYEGNKSDFHELINSPLKTHPFVRSLAWAFALPVLPPLHFHRWAFFDHVIGLSNKSRPFYEFGVWRGEAFRYLIKTFKQGYGFDTFEGLPETWHNEKKGTYSSDGNVPKIQGGKFVVGKFEDTLPGFFAVERPLASIVNFDADLYSSTICALNHAKPIIDRHTVLIFDEFFINTHWELDEYKALEEFCADNGFEYQVIAISFFTKQVAVKLLGI